MVEPCGEVAYGNWQGHGRARLGGHTARERGLVLCQ
jgi:hypothetical protein